MASMASTSNYQQSPKKAKKYRRLGDRISSLPDSILVHILSFLPTNYAVRTCILAKRWNNLWASVPNLHFSFKNFQRHYSQSFDFPDFIDRVLFFHELPRIQSFCLECNNVDLNRLTTWISVAIRRGVQELDVDAGSPDEVLILPPSLFTSITLKVLKLRSELLMEIPGPVHFLNLRVLHVSLHYPGEDIIQKLFCSCPVLEDLFLGGNVDNSRVSDVSMPSLKKLEIDVSRDDGFEYSENEFVVDAPILKHLTLQDDYFAQYVLTNLSSLVKAEINIGDCYIEPRGKKEHANQLYGLLREISNVKYLTLGARTMEALYYADDNNMPLLFPNITHLETSVHNTCCLKRLTYLLHCMPNLEILVLKVVTLEFCGHIDTEELDWIEPEGIPTCLSLHLKEIRLAGFKGQKNGLKLINYFLKNAKVLVNMTINPLVI